MHAARRIGILDWYAGEVVASNRIEAVRAAMHFGMFTEDVLPNICAFCVPALTLHTKGALDCVGGVHDVICWKH